MSELIQDTVYNFPFTNVDLLAGVSVGGAATLEISLDGAQTFQPIGALPLVDGELQGLVSLSSCQIRAVNVTGQVLVKPDLSEFTD